MAYSFYLTLVLGAFIGGFVNGLAGFGTALFALGFFLAVMPPLQAVAVIVALSVFSGALGLYHLWQAIGQNKAAIIALSVPGMLGVPLGVWALSFVSSDMLRLLIAVLLLLYGGFFSFRTDLPRLQGRFLHADALIGFIGGMLGGLAALSGALPTMWYALRDRHKQDARIILQCYNFSLLSLTSALLIAKGAFDMATSLYALIAVLVALIGARFGLALYHKLDTRHFQRLLIVMCFLSGSAMVYQIISAS